MDIRNQFQQGSILLLRIFLSILVNVNQNWNNLSAHISFTYFVLLLFILSTYWNQSLKINYPI